MTFRQFVLVTHRWLGLAAAIGLLAAGLSGAVLVWPGVVDPYRDAVERFHTRLALGEPGEWLVISATAVSVALAIGDPVLWWKRKQFRISVTRGGWRFLFDLHHSLGILFTVLMLIISVTGIGLVLTEHEDGSPLSPAENRVRLRLAHVRGPGRLRLRHVVEGAGATEGGLTTAQCQCLCQCLVESEHVRPSIQTP